MALTLPGIAKLRNAALVLRETTGFAYLPIIVPHEVAARDALQELQRASAVADDQWHEVMWPEAAARAAPSLPLTPEAIAEQREAFAGQRKALLQSFDTQLLQDAHAGHALVLDASPSTRHALATEVVTYLNQRREPLRSHQRRLILVWPAALSDILLGGTPDLWSQRALSVVLDEDDVVLPLSDAAFESSTATQTEPIRTSSGISNPVIRAQLAQWFEHHDLLKANLSSADALTLAKQLRQQYDHSEAQLIAEAVLNADPENLDLRSEAYLQLSLALHAQGKRDRALGAAANSVEIRRRLAHASPAVYEPDLAGSLSNFASFQSATGDRAGALSTALEAVKIFRRLAHVSPAAYEPDLARSLNNFAGFQNETGNRIGALSTALEAVEIRRRLARASPAAYEADLAKSLNNLAGIQSETGNRAGALSTALEAVEIFRRLALASPAAYEPDLAASLNNLANRQSATGNRADALSTALQAVEIRRRLARANPAAYEPDLARALCVLALAHATAGDMPAARAFQSEAVSLLTPWAQKMPDAFAPLRDAAQNLLAEFAKNT